MKPMSLGDSAQFLAMRRNGTTLKTQISALNAELTTGIAADKGQHLRGDFGVLASITRAIDMAQINISVAQTASLQLQTQQTVLARLHDNATEALNATRLVLSGDTDTPIHLRMVAFETSASAFDDAVMALNASVAGRYVFAGQQSDTAPLAAPAAILDALMGSLPSDAGASELLAHVESWFAPMGDFDTIAYHGGNPNTSGLNLGAGYDVQNTLTAQDSAIRKHLGALAYGALMARGVLADAPADQIQVLQVSTAALDASVENLTTRAAALGIQQARTGQAVVAARAQSTALEIARTELIGVDSYETATRLQDAMTKLDTIYMMTARLSRLSLTEYLR